jgi:hypothetical protein
VSASISRGLWGLLVVLLGGLVCQLPTVSAAFTATTSNPPNGFALDTVAVLTGLSASKVCMAQVATGATPTYQGKTTASGSVNSVTLNVPAGTAQGDLLIVQIAIPDNQFNIHYSSNTPVSGWYTIRRDTAYTVSVASYLIYHFADATEPASYTFPIAFPGGGTSTDYAAAMLQFSGVDPRSPFDAHAGTLAATSSTSVVAPGLTTVADNVLLISFATINAQTSFTAPTGMTEVYNIPRSGTKTVTAEAATQSFATAGATGIRTATAANAGVSAAQLVALRPSAIHPAPLYAAKSGFSDNSGGGVSITRPDGATAGDLLVIGAAWNGALSAAPATPAGWTQIRADANDPSVSAGWWYKVASGTETWPLSFAPSSAKPMTTLIYRIAGVDTSNPIAGSNVGTGTSTTITAPGLTVTNDHTLTLNLGANNDTTGYVQNPVGTESDGTSFAGSGSTYVNIGLSHTIATSTTTAAVSFKADNSKPWIGSSIAINPVPDPYTINAGLSWTASTTSWATGYTWERWTVSLQQTGSVSDRTTTTATDTTVLTSGTTYTYKLRTDASNWHSAKTTTTLTPTCP